MQHSSPDKSRRPRPLAHKRRPASRPPALSLDPAATATQSSATARQPLAGGTESWPASAGRQGSSENLFAQVAVAPASPAPKQPARQSTPTPHHRRHRGTGARLSDAARQAGAQELSEQSDAAELQRVAAATDSVDAQGLPDQPVDVQWLACGTAAGRIARGRVVLRRGLLSCISAAVIVANARTSGGGGEAAIASLESSVAYQGWQAVRRLHEVVVELHAAIVHGESCMTRCLRCPSLGGSTGFPWRHRGALI